MESPEPPSTPGGASTPVAPSTPVPSRPTVPLEGLTDFLRHIVPLRLDVTSSDVDRVLRSPAAAETLNKFASDPQVRVLVAQRWAENGEAPKLRLDTEVNTRAAGGESLAFIKKQAVLETERPIKAQVRVLDLDEQAPIEMLHDYIHAAVSPFVTSFVTTTAQQADKTKLGPVKRQLADLELALLNLQQDAEIPDVRLVIHPLIQAKLAEARSAGRKVAVEDFGAVDDNVLNEIQKTVATWVKEILKVTTLERDASAGSAAQEVSFWVNMERALELIQQRLRQEDVEITMALLRHCKRFMATVGFENDTRLKEAIDKVSNYNQVMKDFPINELLAATEIKGMGSALRSIFTHMNKIRNTKYPVPRAMLFETALSKALDDQMRKVLSHVSLLTLNYDDFDELMDACRSTFKIWSECDRQYQEVLRDMARKRKEHHQVTHGKGRLPHQGLMRRLEKLQEFRRQHRELGAVVTKVLKKDASGMSDQTALEEINQAYDRMRSIDILDTSDEGFEAFDTALKAYNARIDRVEAEITASLRDQLATARNANEMFRIFSKFNALFVRPRVRGAIQEYQSQLINRVKEDINALQETFKVQYQNTQAARMSEVRDLPPTSGRIIWYRQIERQLATYMKRVSDVLGAGWESHPEGKKLKEQGDSFQGHINTQKLFEEWVAQAETRQVQTSGRIFTIGGKRQLQLKLNFDSQTIILFKETRLLENCLGFRVPYALKQMATVVSNLYPMAVYLEESIRTYTQTCAKVTDVVSPLVADLHRQVQTAIAEGVGTGWESHRLDGYVKRLSNEVYSYQEKVDEVLELTDKISGLLEEMGSCDLSRQALGDRLGAIQNLVDDLNLKKFSNLTLCREWVKSLDQQVEDRLLQRLQQVLQRWLESFTQTPTDLDDDGRRASKDGSALVALETKVHEIRITNQIMYLSPPLEAARADFLHQLHDWLGVICSLPRTQSSRFEIGGLSTEMAEADTNYQNLLLRLQADGSLLQGAYTAIERRLAEVKDYVDTWLNYQALWDLDPNTVYARLGDDLHQWHQLLVEIKDARSTFDNLSTFAVFGTLVIDYGQVQSKVNMKYDTWHKEMLNHFGTKVGQATTDMYAQISKARAELETHTVETSTAEAVAFITFVQDLKRKLKSWKNQVDTIKSSQKLLERQRYQFPAEWLYTDMLDGEWSAFNDILVRKDTLIQNEIAALQVKILAEARTVEQKVSELLGEWEKEKPIQGNLNPAAVANALAIFDGKFNRANDEYERLQRAKEALDLDMTGENKLTPAMSELSGLKAVWAELNKLWGQVDELKEMPWVSVVPRKVRQQLDGLLEQMRALPNRMRQYAAYDHLQNTLKGYLKVNALILELKSEALRERHWKDLQKQLRVSWALSELTLGNIWDADLQRNENVVRDIITVAQGEMGLEEFLKQVRETWTTYEVELVNYQNKTRLVKGWDDLFNKLKEQLNQLHAMKLSPYYKVFAEEGENWEDKLNRINSLFDVWIDVQRRWVYLEGIFTGSADIANLLPVETSRFGSISSEFLSLMKKVSKNPLVMDVLAIPNAQRSLERLADLLGKVQKALGDYLERERSSFPRFYFVGDEDLLEIIGNSKDISKLQKHFRKMFAGIHLVLLNEDETEVLGMASKEGEEVRFVKPVNIKENPKINTYLLLIEQQMRLSLAHLLAQAVEKVTTFTADKFDGPQYLQWVDQYPSQLVSLSAQVAWSHNVEEALKNGGKTLGQVEANVEAILTFLADTVLTPQPPVLRRKLEQLITELVHQRDVVRQLAASGTDSHKSFEWLTHMRFYFDPKKLNVLDQLRICMADASFNYGFEYLGVTDKLVQTPLTDRCYLTMTQALMKRLGGSPFGPAGTGKTEFRERNTVPLVVTLLGQKALGNQLGRFVLVFNCDETFDFKAMGRIFIGLCQVGAWGCFDEFNRLEERILSAVSQQIQMIQTALRDATDDDHIETELMGRTVGVRPDMAIFVTMNPGYAGRSNLPDNLKQLFRSLAMTTPDRQLIAQVMLYSQGFRTAEKLASKVVPLFKLCAEQLSAQSHYDFGLRALKSVLVSAGNVKREKIKQIKAQAEEQGQSLDESAIAGQLNEQEILIQSVCETMVPKLVAEDIPLLFSLLSDVFPGVKHTPEAMTALRREISKVCEEQHYVEGEMWVDKILQMYQIQNIHHGVMMVGPSGSGKSSAWRVLLTALERVEGVQGVSYVMDPKAISKDDLYGTLDPTTREWTDGLFTHVLRKIVDNVRNESAKRHWIVFDGDVDPEWVENLNSVLDDNKILTLPNGERLGIPPNVRIMFEVQDLKYATLATVSRCGMVWFSSDVLSTSMVFKRYLARLSNVPLDAADDEPVTNRQGQTEVLSPVMQVQRDCVAILGPQFESNQLVEKTLNEAEKLDHIMDFTRLRVVGSLLSMLDKGVRNILHYNSTHMDFPMDSEIMEKYILKFVVYALVWCFAGDSKLKSRKALGEYIRSITAIPLPASGEFSIIDYEPNVNNGEWTMWKAKVPVVEVETHKVGAPDVVIPTVDTVRHEDLLYTWLADHKPMVLCGPPGSGKTMTLFSALRALPDMEVVGLNFSSATSPELLLRTFEHYCEYRKTPNGVVLAPTMLGKWLVLFCDEINLPDFDHFGTQRVISFLRQMVEHGGFWRTSDHTWVRLERIQFVGACNPPTDPGRKPLSPRFLRHVPVVLVDYPGQDSLMQIYGTFNRALLRLFPNLRSYAENLTAAMVEFYTLSQERFTVDMQPHYIYSPRELTRWVRGVFEAIKPLENLTVEMLVRTWAHEALRLFQDRLVLDEEREWTEEHVNKVAEKYFQHADLQAALKRPILFSNWLSKDYVSVDLETLRDFVKARLRVFYEEELDVPLVLFNAVLDHVLRIDRVFRQPQGHMLLIGVSGSGKTTLSRFVAWINGLRVFQIKVHNKYTMVDFDDDLRLVLRQAGCKGEKICFIMDESNILDAGFLERMNTLLANGEVPGLFEGDEYAALMTQCKEGSQREGLMLDSSDELYKWFCNQVMRNLHVVFTMNPTTTGLKDRAATSPALFNRCVLDWFGDWANEALYQVALEFTAKVDLDDGKYIAPMDFPAVLSELPTPPAHRQAVINAFVYVHQTLHDATQRLARRQGRHMHITPRHFLDFINHYVRLFNEKRADLEDQQLHLNVGLRKIDETVSAVEELQKTLSVKKVELERANVAANEKLKQMVHDQQEAERRRTASIAIQEELQVKESRVAERKQLVEADLAGVAPAVEEAALAVRSIKKQQLVEVRALTNPPKMVKMAMECVCTLLGETNLDWKAIRGVIIRDDFITNIVNFDTDSISDKLRKTIIKDFISQPEFNYETVNRASKACGPLVKWVIAQVNYSDMLQKIEPLRNELRELEASARDTKREVENTVRLIDELETSINRYKEEYAALISQAQQIKTEMSTVETKVNRSIALLDSLSSEQERWRAESTAFQTQMGTIVGDVLLSAAFLAYGGYFDQQARANLFTQWVLHLQKANIECRSDLSLAEYLSTADERLQWQANGLPVDDLCTENAVMLQRYNRYPLIIDPSGQATRFLVNQFKDRKITKTSFLDDAFRKNLESALRFGNPLLVQDVENYDPILNPVLNRELRRTGGRVLIRLGDQDIDFSPAFNIFLTTRDPTVNFSPDICSRVTFVNFTITPSSLQSQCLNQVLTAERPDVDQKRSDLLKLQGEFRLRLRHLEKALLDALNSAKGKILDDDNIITTLETLKQEAAAINKKVSETDAVMLEVEQVSDMYRPLAVSCSAIYFTMEQLAQVHHLYQYSLQFFLDIFHNVLHENPHLVQPTDHAQRLQILLHDIFVVTFKRVSRSLLHEDQLALALMLSFLRVRGGPDEIPEAVFSYFRAGARALAHSDTTSSDSVLPAHVQARLHHLASSLPQFRELLAHITDFQDEWKAFVASPQPELCVPVCWVQEENFSPVRVAFNQLLVVQAARPDRTLAQIETVVVKVFGLHVLHGDELDLAEVVDKEVKANTPILMCSVPGYDASHYVENIAQGHSLKTIAIGSSEGYALAEKAIAAAARSGDWVLLKNVHLSPSWLVSLEKTKLHTLNAQSAFRLFMSMEISPKVGVNLLRMSRIFVFEPPPGIKASLQHTLHSIPQSRMDRAPAERSRLYFLLAWFHAIVQERLRYVPLGWSKRYEFNDSDLRCALDTLDTWIDGAANGRANIPPDAIPWEALRRLLAHSIYGGRVDNEFDQRLLSAFLDALFTPRSFDLDFPLVMSEATSAETVTIPDARSRADFLAWIDALPDQQSPHWLGLPPTADVTLRAVQATELTSKLLRMQASLEDASDLDQTEKRRLSLGRRKSTSKDPKQVCTDGEVSRPSWMVQLQTTCEGYLLQLPASLGELGRTVENIKDPLFRCLEREVTMALHLLHTVRHDLQAVVDICAGKRKQTNYLRTIVAELSKGQIPKAWNRYTIAPTVALPAWVADFGERVQQLSRLVASGGGLGREPLWLGGLFVPEAYITATRQAVAQGNGWSLEELALEVELEMAGDQAGPGGFVITGISMEGAAPAPGNTLQLTKDPSTGLARTQLKWVRVEGASVGQMVNLPVYLNSTRKELLFTVDVKAPGADMPPHVLYQRGVALVLSSLM